MLSNNNLYTHSNNMTLGISKIQTQKKKKRAYPGVQILRLGIKRAQEKKEGKEKKKRNQ